MLRSLSISSWATDWMGMPVQRAITSSTSARVTSRIRFASSS